MGLPYSESDAIEINVVYNQCFDQSEYLGLGITASYANDLKRSAVRYLSIGHCHCHCIGLSDTDTLHDGNSLQLRNTIQDGNSLQIRNTIGNTVKVGNSL